VQYLLKQLANLTKRVTRGQSGSGHKGQRHHQHDFKISVEEYLQMRYETIKRKSSDDNHVEDGVTDSSSSNNSSNNSSHSSSSDNSNSSNSSGYYSFIRDSNDSINNIAIVDDNNVKGDIFADNDIMQVDIHNNNHSNLLNLFTKRRSKERDDEEAIIELWKQVCNLLYP
jgi:hypothetical protein